MSATSDRGAVPLEEFLSHTPTRSIDAFIHSAAIRHRHGRDEGAYRASNVDLPARAARVLTGQIGRFVFVSSVGVYGWPATLPVTERHPFAPRTLYSETKVLAERRMKELASELAFDLTIVRPTIFYGPGDDNGMLDKMARTIAAHRYAIVGDGQNVLHHTYVDDIVDGTLLAAEHPAASNEDFILAGPETTTLRELSVLVARAVGVRLPPVSIPLRVARVVASAIDTAARRGIAFQRREPPVNHEKLDVMTLPISFDIRKARSLLGYAPKVGYADGVPRAVRRGGP
jgi:nucleoside-diphosphate-sugar epimerase